jgi:hypothetical protein
MFWNIAGNITALQTLARSSVDKITRSGNSLGHDLKFLVSDIGKMMTEGVTCLQVERSCPWGWKPWGINFNHSRQRQGKKKSMNSAEEIILCSICNFEQHSLPAVSSCSFYLALCMVSQLSRDLLVISGFLFLWYLSSHACWKSEQ